MLYLQEKTLSIYLKGLEEEATDLLFMPLLIADMEGGIPEEIKQKIDPSLWVKVANNPGLMQVPPCVINKRSYTAST